MSRGRVGEFHPRSKITMPMAVKIYQDIESGMKTVDIARKYELSRWTINNMAKGSHWTYKQWRSH